MEGVIVVKINDLLDLGGEMRSLFKESGNSDELKHERVPGSRQLFGGRFTPSIFFYLHAIF